MRWVSLSQRAASFQAVWLYTQFWLGTLTNSAFECLKHLRQESHISVRGTQRGWVGYMNTDSLPPTCCHQCGTTIWVKLQLMEKDGGGLPLTCRFKLSSYCFFSSIISLLLFSRTYHLSSLCAEQNLNTLNSPQRWGSGGKRKNQIAWTYSLSNHHFAVPDFCVQVCASVCNSLGQTSLGEFHTSMGIWEL